MPEALLPFVAIVVVFSNSSDKNTTLEGPNYLILLCLEKAHIRGTWFYCKFMITNLQCCREILLDFVGQHSSVLHQNDFKFFPVSINLQHLPGPTLLVGDLISCFTNGKTSHQVEIPSSSEKHKQTYFNSTHSTFPSCDIIRQTHPFIFPTPPSAILSFLSGMSLFLFSPESVLLAL